MIAYHRSQRADATVAVYSVPMSEAHRYGVLDMDPSGRIVDFQEKPTHPKAPWISMGVYCFNKDVLVEQLTADSEEEGSRHDFGRDVIPAMYRTHRVCGYQYQGYWRDVGTVESYWESHMDLLGAQPPMHPGEGEQRLWTAGGILPAARFGPAADVRESLISPGTRIDGSVWRSVISPGVIVEAGAVVRESIIQHRCVIQAGAVVDRCILDKEVTVGHMAVLGEGESHVANVERPDIVNTGISIVGKRVTVPKGLRVGRNVVIGPGVQEELSGIESLPAGSTVHPKKMPLDLFV